ncbi:CHRD domain-containing protein [Streptomyces sp. NPDC102467]|uniref:CHRD domain-containing protein n=1 Tax=Streptomyces sp. NPDC102467 TaxID=3366179 RepID=UPI0037FC3A51
MGTRILLAAASIGAAAFTTAALTVPAAVADRGRPETGARETVLVASLKGANEVPVKGGPAVGDKDGMALEFVRLKGDKVSVTARWDRVGKPIMLHIHQGAKGVNGAIKVDFTKLLRTAHQHRVTGTVTVRDRALLRRIAADPGGFYANLHTAEFPGGAVRGQLHRVHTGK